MLAAIIGVVAVCAGVLVVDLLMAVRDYQRGYNYE